MSIKSSGSSTLPALPLPPQLRERQVTSDASDLSYHIIEAGSHGKPLVILLHGFPEIAYSWRKVMPDIADGGYYVIAVDQRGYGRTTGWDTSSFEDVDLRTFSVTALVRDIVVLVYALGYHEVHCVVGHDFGAVAASLCALMRPDFFHKVVLMSHPFKGIPQLSGSRPRNQKPESDIHQALSNLPEPRKHYKWYYSTSAANREMSPCQGLKKFLRGYFYLKSADWPGNEPKPLKSWTADELAKMPYYYVMPLDAGMRDVVAKAQSPENLEWLPDAELAVYADEYGRTGFQGGLNWYRVQTDPSKLRDLDLFAGKKIEVPCLFVSGTKDWGIFQEPGVVERMGEHCSDYRGAVMIEDAGHWVQQEQPGKVVSALLDFVQEYSESS